MVLKLSSVLTYGCGKVVQTGAIVLFWQRLLQEVPRSGCLARSDERVRLVGTSTFRHLNQEEKRVRGILGICTCCW